MNEYLTQTTLLRLLGVMLLVTAPHLMRLPTWEIVLVLAVIGWRGLIAVRQWRLPNTALRIALTLLAFVGVYAQFRSISGLTAGTALLCAMAALKLLEMRARRDVMVTVILMYFILVTHFLFSQEMWTVLYLLASTALITALLMDCNHPGAALPLAVLLRGSTRLVAYALPLMVALFVLFPRIPGPLWSLPTDSGTARSGLSDQMAPGDVSSLMQTDDVVFRVRFADRIPEPGQRYWRGPVFDRFDGRGWQLSSQGMNAPADVIEPLGDPLHYSMTLEAQGSRWLLALDVPSPGTLPPNSRLEYGALLLADKPVDKRRQIAGTAHPRYRLHPTLTPRERQRHVQLPPRYNPRTHALAQQWRETLSDDAAIVERALMMFRRDGFAYTLKPPPLTRDSVDDFLFNTRQGFCEHYASSFTVLMRAAGIPARIVTGYQGGEKNDYDDYYVVRQYDAHAWSEVWLPDRGWVRVDPTGAVAPERVERGLSSALTVGAGLPAFIAAQRQGARRTFSMRLDWVNAKWNAWVLAYGPDLQAEFLRNFGIEDLGAMILTLTAVITAMMGLIGLLLMRPFRPAHPPDAALKYWRRATRRLARAGFMQREGEGPQDYIDRVIRERPDLEPALLRLLDAYLRLRYLETPDAALLQTLAAAERAMRV